MWIKITKNFLNKKGRLKIVIDSKDYGGRKPDGRGNRPVLNKLFHRRRATPDKLELTSNTK